METKFTIDGTRMTQCYWEKTVGPTKMMQEMYAFLNMTCPNYEHKKRQMPCLHQITKPRYELIVANSFITTAHKYS